MDQQTRDRIAASHTYPHTGVAPTQSYHGAKGSYLQRGDGSWRDPDKFYDKPEHPDAVTFAFHDGQLTTGPGTEPHNKMWLQQGGAQRFGNRYLQRGARVAAGSLEGRISSLDGSGVRVVSFWNHRPEHYQQYLEACLAAMLQQRLIGPDDIVATPLCQEFTVRELNRQNFQAPSADRQAEIERRRELHTLRGAEKHQALRAAGATPAGVHPLSREMEHLHLAPPGSKWWAMNSEASDVDQIADMITEDPDLFED